jgi:hypothetical protein
MSYDFLAYDPNPVAMIADIANEFNGQAEEISGYDSEYVENHEISAKEDKPKARKLEIYESMVDSIDNDVHEFFGELKSQLVKLYYNGKRISALKDEAKVYSLIIEGLGILEIFYQKSHEVSREYETSLGFRGDESYLDAASAYYGVDLKKYFKKQEDLTIEDYKYAFDSILEFGEFVENNSNLVITLKKIAAELFAHCKIILGEHVDVGTLFERLSTERIENDLITIRNFVKKYCESKQAKPQMLNHWRKLLNNYNLNGKIRLPEPQKKNWSPGMAKHYMVKDLKERWPDYCKSISSLPLLK